MLSGWSDTQVVASVAPGSGSGMVEIQQGRNMVERNSVLTLARRQYLACRPPSGCRELKVTITGSGFGSTQGSVWLGTANGAIVSWSDTQVGRDSRFQVRRREWPRFCKNGALSNAGRLDRE